MGVEEMVAIEEVYTAEVRNEVFKRQKAATHLQIEGKVIYTVVVESNE
jgi:hypothetical protein